MAPDSPLEVERKFLVASLPPGWETLPARELEQGYALRSADGSLRLRRDGARRVLTLKTGHGMVRRELEVELDAAQFDALWPSTEGVRLAKRRIELPLGSGHVAELDLYDGPLAGRRTVEVEFASEDAAAVFVPPPWFGRELTTDERYSNLSLALHGWPEEGGADGGGAEER